MQDSTIPVSGTEEERRVPWIAERNLLYRTVDAPGGQATNLACLDLFFTKDQRPKRVVVYVHGGKWIGGDKSEIENYPRLLDFFVSNDCVVASVNFRLAKQGRTRVVSYQDQARDIAAALKWLTAHVEEYGGRGQDFVLFGYSSGAHLAALVALDEQYLASAGLDGAVIRSVIAMDIHAYDIPAALTLMEGTPLRANIPRMISLFGESREEQEAASPASYVSEARPKSFLLFSCAMSGRLSQTISRAISSSFKEKLVASGHKALHEHLALHDHHEILSSFGRPHDAVPENIKVFLDIEAAAHPPLQDGRERHPVLQPSTRNFRLEAVRLAETTDRPTPEIAQEFGVRIDELYAWMKEFKKHRKMRALLSGGTSRPVPQKDGKASQMAVGKFSEEFKRKAVDLTETKGRPAAEIAREFGVGIEELYAWMKEFKRHRKMSALLPGGTSRPGPQKGGQASHTGVGKFSEEFKRKAVDLTETKGRPAAEIARELGVGIDKVYAWKRELKRRDKTGTPTTGSNKPIGSGGERKGISGREREIQ